MVDQEEGESDKIGGRRKKGTIGVWKGAGRAADGGGPKTGGGRRRQTRQGSAGIGCAACTAGAEAGAHPW